MNLLVTLLALTGLFFLSIAALGFVRLPDVYSRLHVNGIVDTLGAPLLLAAAALHVGWDLAAGKLLLGMVLLLVGSPLMGHLLSRAALRSRHPAHRKTLPDEPGRKGTLRPSASTCALDGRHRALPGDFDPERAHPRPVPVGAQEAIADR